MRNTQHKFAVVFAGAPYGANEGGQVEHTAKTEAAAANWLSCHFGNSPRGYDMRIVNLDDKSHPRYYPMTPREYFGL